MLKNLLSHLILTCILFLVCAKDLYGGATLKLHQAQKKEQWKVSYTVIGSSTKKDFHLSADRAVKLPTKSLTQIRIISPNLSEAVFMSRNEETFIDFDDGDYEVIFLASMACIIKVRTPGVPYTDENLHMTWTSIISALDQDDIAFEIGHPIFESNVSELLERLSDDKTDNENEEDPLVFMQYRGYPRDSAHRLLAQLPLTDGAI